MLPVFRWIGTIARIVAVAIGGISAPVWIAIAAIAAIIAIGVLLYKNWEKISDGAMAMSRKVGDKFMEMHTKIGLELGRIKTAIEVKWNNIKSWLMNLDLAAAGRDIIQGLIDGINGMADNVATAAKNIGNGIADKDKSILKLGSPSKVMIGMGEDTGEGFAIGMKNSMSEIKSLSKEMAVAAIPNGKKSAATTANMSGAANGKSLTVNLHSPKTLDVKEANRQFNRTLNKMSLMW